MPRSRPASNPISYHKLTGQYYVTRAGKRLYLGADKDEAREKFHLMNLGLVQPEKSRQSIPISAKELANRFLTTQRANWRNPKITLRGYRDWLSRFLRDHPRLKIQEFTVEMFSSWKLSLRERGYSPKSINHFLSAVRSIFKFAEDTDLLEKAPALSRVKNESSIQMNRREKPLYTTEHIASLLGGAGGQLKAMLLLGLNCG